MSIVNFPFWRVVPGESGASSTYDLHVMQAATVGPEGAGHIMGGVAMGALIDAMELESELPLLFAQVQFLSPTQHAEKLSIHCEQCGGGQSIAQYAASASVNGRPTHRASAALGAREPSEPVQFLEMPEVPGPEQCASMEREFGVPGDLLDQYDLRIAAENNDAGTRAIWTRSYAGLPVDAGWLAIISDLFLGSHPRSIGPGSSSLDAMLRFVQGAEPGWVLSVTEFANFGRGVVHGSARHFSQDGKLLAISSQTGVLPRVPLAEMMP